MNILHVLSQVFVSGPEFYVATLARHHQKQGHETVIISDTFTAPVNAIIVQAHIHQRDVRRRLSNIAAVRRVIRERGIDVVHAHSRAASWVCFWAVKGTDVPLVSTVHGRQHIHFSTRFHAVYGTSVIAVCENLARHLINDVGMPENKIIIIPNGIDMAQNREMARKPNGKVLSIIGRVNGPKGAKTASFIQNAAARLLERYPDLVIRIAGGDSGKLPEGASLEIARLNERFGNRIETPGFVKNIDPFLRESTLVICSGRVAIEALWLGVPTIALGEACCNRLVTEENFKEAAASNFGDILPDKKADAIDFENLGREIASILDGQNAAAPISNLVRERYSADTVAKRVMDVYVRSRILKKHSGPIPVLMYHKVTSDMPTTSHRIFVPEKRFKQHLRFFKLGRFTALTFSEYNNFGTGASSLASFPKKPLILTFDDGYETAVSNALPLMNAYGFHGVVFLLGDAQKSHNFWDSNRKELHNALAGLQQRQLFRKAGWEIGAHSMTHRDLTKLDDTQAGAEIGQSKKSLEDEFGATVDSFAYPFGFCDERIKKLVSKAGFSFGVATDTGGMRIEDDRFQVFRISIFPQDSFFQLWKKTSPWYRRYYKWKRKK